MFTSENQANVLCQDLPAHRECENRVLIKLPFLFFRCVLEFCMCEAATRTVGLTLFLQVAPYRNDGCE